MKRIVSMLIEVGNKGPVYAWTIGIGLALIALSITGMVENIMRELQ
jgi:hypothetical protein